ALYRSDAWGARVTRRAQAKLRQEDRDTPALDPVDFVMWVDDEARVGALRLFDPQSGAYLRAGGANRHVPPLVELDKVLHAARALEDGTESAQDLRYLLGQGTSLGGASPKSTVRDTDGRLAVGKFPSQADRRDVIRGEVAQAVAGWRALARGLGMRGSDLLDFEPAFVESTTP